MCDCEGALTNGLGLGFLVPPEGSAFGVFKSVLANGGNLGILFEEFGKPDVDGNETDETDGCETVEIFLCSSDFPDSLWSSSTPVS